MIHTEPGSLCLEPGAPESIPTITAVRPVDRYALQNYIANLRHMLFDGVQVPFRVVHVDPDTCDEQEEHIPGCMGCSR